VKIAHFLHGRANPNGVNGGDKIICRLASSTAELGQQVFILGVSNKPWIPVRGVTVQHVAPQSNPFEMPPSLVDTLHNIRPDIVHFHGIYTPKDTVVARWLRRKGINYVVSPHGGLMPGVLARNYLKKMLYLRIVARSYCQEASLMHAVSDAEAGSIRALLPNVEVAVAPPGVEGLDLRSLESNYLHKRYPPVIGKKVLGFLGRLDGYIKGLDLLVKACSLNRAKLHNVIICLAGPDWQNKTVALRRLVAELKISDMVHFLGPLTGKEKFDFLASCHAVILPSRSEGLPLSVIEALELGKPCLVSEAASLGDFLQRHKAGMQFPPTIQGVANALLFFQRSTEEELGVMGAEGRRAALDEFSWARSSAKLLRAYEEVCKKSSPKPFFHHIAEHGQNRSLESHNV